MDWTEENTLQLIQLFKEREVLWNPKNVEYKNRQKRHDALCELANELSTDKSEVERKLKNLTSHYNREKNRCDDSKKPGSGVEVYISKWFAYKALNFLRSKKKPKLKRNVKNSRNNANSSDVLQNHNDLGKQTKRQKIATEVLSIINDVAQITHRDEDALFAAYIGEQLRKMDVTTKAIVRHRINTVMFEAQTGYALPQSENLGFVVRPSLVSSPGHYASSSVGQPFSPGNNSLSSALVSPTPTPPPTRAQDDTTQSSDRAENGTDFLMDIKKEE